MTIIYVTLKQCSRKEKCVNPFGSWLPATEEYFRKRGEGVRSNCLFCESAYQRLYRQQHLEEAKAYQQVYYREHREEARMRYRLWVSYHPQKVNKYKRLFYQRHRKKILNSNASWRAAHRDYNVVYRTTHREEQHAYDAAYYARHTEAARAKSHRRRARKLGNGGAHTATDILLQVRSQTDKKGKLRCWWCGKPIKGGYHVDHVIPLARGGGNGAENLCIACPSCNRSKGNKLPQEWSGRLL